ncbi:MAG: ATP-dependent DNA helicase RecG [Spirochaetia bacterium]
MLIEDLTLPIDRLKGLGEESQKAFANLGVYNIGDLILYFPLGYEDRATIIPLAQVIDHKSSTCIVEVLEHEFLQLRGDRVLKVIVGDESARAVLVCFGRNFLQNTLVIGQKYFIYGQFQYKYNEIQCSSFEVEIHSNNPENFLKIIPVYGLSGTLKQNKIRKMVQQSFELCPGDLQLILPESMCRENGEYQNKKHLLYDLHFPKNWKNYDQSREILLKEELYTFQLAMCWKRSIIHQKKRTASGLSRQFFQAAKLRLPFSLTADQDQVIEEIFQDLGKEYPMRRLLQGDVGTGKTLVAFLAACPLLEERKQVALMAPTELLARQHAENAAKLLEPLGIHVAFLTSNIRNQQRKQVLHHLANAQIHFVVGTHALFSGDVHYANLSLIIIDEQHRFGVGQREKLLAKGENADLLLMSATPIPRTLALSIFGDLEISQLSQYPQGRLPVRTHLVQSANIQKVHAVVLGQLQAGHQAYYVYPLIQESEQSDLKSAQAVYEVLSNEVFQQYKVGLIHARLDEEEKRKIMAQFAQGYLQVLVATSIVEVGVDIANATVMVIESAQRFGLAALHQLRGRVGRSNLQSYCFFVYDELSEEGKQRMKILYENSDGFIIAQEDLRLRGPGEFAGFRQSGAARFLLANLEIDGALFIEMRDLAIENFEKKQNDPIFLQYIHMLKKKNKEASF